MVMNERGRVEGEALSSSTVICRAFLSLSFSLSLVFLDCVVLKDFGREVRLMVREKLTSLS